jgi:CRISPR/Cas system-associated protein Cas5 (RAMP superfamily)
MNEEKFFTKKISDFLFVRIGEESKKKTKEKMEKCEWNVKKTEL